MSQNRDIISLVQEVQSLLTAKFGIKQAALLKMMRRAGRRLPRRIHRCARELDAAHQQSSHPKLALQLDKTKAIRAYHEIITFLQAIDVADRRKGQVLSVAGTVAFNILVVIFGFVLWLWWRGYV